jgi:hypothetical protein
MPDHRATEDENLSARTTSTDAQKQLRSQRSLGIVPIPEAAIHHDFAIQQRYQDFTAEVLRLSLLGISAIGFVMLKYLFPDKQAPITMPCSVQWPFAIALASFGFASLSALAHRYVSVDSLAYPLQAIRKEIRADPADAQSAAQDRQSRYLRFRISRYAVIVAAAALGIGACSLAYSFFKLMTTL